MGVFNEDQVEALNNLPRILRPLGGPFDYILSDGGEGLGDLLNKLITADDAPSSTTGTNVGSGAYVFKDKSGDNLRFRSIVGGTDIDVAQTTNEITIDNVATDTTLQEAYDESTDGSITIDGSKGSVKILDASPSIEDNLFEIRDTSGDPLFRITTDTTASELGIRVDTNIRPESTDTISIGDEDLKFYDFHTIRLTAVSLYPGTDPSNVSFSNPGVYTQGGIIAGRAQGDGELILGGGSRPASALIGSSNAYTGATSLMQARGGGSLVFGSSIAGIFFGAAPTSEISTGTLSFGGLAGGYAFSATGGTSTIRNYARGSFIWGVTYGTGSNTASITTTQNSGGSFVQGYSKNGTLRSYESLGAFVQGYSGGNNSPIIEAYNAKGSFAQGYTGNAGRIRAISDGSFAQGRAVGSNSSTLIQSSAYGAFAQGAVDNTRQLVSSGVGSSALGYAASANITASGAGSLAIGYTGSSTVISATANNAFQFAQGTNSTANSLQVGSGVLLQTNGDVRIDGDIDHNGSNIGFFSVSPAAQQNITGARDDPEAALANLLTGLANLGLITDSTTAS